jgi:hypothetical protein
MQHFVPGVTYVVGIAGGVPLLAETAVDFLGPRGSVLGQVAGLEVLSFAADI